LSSTLASATALTVFLPTTEAFLQIGQDQQLALLHNDTAFHSKSAHELRAGDGFAVTGFVRA
jgi:uncharacterized surface protein with fasciclin (FAS1) repeats